MLDIEKIRKLIEMMVSNDLLEITLRNGEEEVSLRRPNSAMGGGLPEVSLHPFGHNPGAIASVPAAPTAVSEAESSKEEDDSTLVEIISPMVGTFYAASDPDTPPFVKIGQEVGVGSVVCILEAMKVFNEIKSEVTGTLERVLVKNAQPVEYGQPLFLVRPH